MASGMDRTPCRHRPGLWLVHLRRAGRPHPGALHPRRETALTALDETKQQLTQAYAQVHAVTRDQNREWVLSQRETALAQREQQAEEVHQEAALHIEEAQVRAKEAELRAQRATNAFQRVKRKAQLKSYNSV